MAESLIIKDGLGIVKSLTVESGSFGLMPVHYVTSSTNAPVYITASSANPLPVTGNISVDVTVGDLITVTSSQANPVWVTGAVTVNTGSQITVTASLNNPTGITGTVNVNNSTLTVTSSLANPIWVTGSTVVDVIIGDIINVTASAASPVYVTGSITVNTASSVVSVSNFPATQTITASLASPVGVTGTVNINNFPATQTVTSSILNPVYALAATPAVTTVVQTVSSSFVWNTTPSGTFALATANPLRRGLTVFNPGPFNLYVALSTAGGGGDIGRHGFTLVNTASAPSVYSFIVYPSGTYSADATTVGVYHGGYFISGSASAGVFISAIS